MLVERYGDEAYSRGLDVITTLQRGGAARGHPRTCAQGC